MKHAWAPAITAKPLAAHEPLLTKRHQKVCRFFRKLTDDQIVAFVASISRALDQSIEIDPDRMRATCIAFVERQP